MKQFSSPLLQIFNSQGNAEPYGRLLFYKEPGLVPLVVYKDQALTIPHPIEIAADAAGAFPQVFLPSGYYTYTVEVRDRHNFPVHSFSGQEAPDGAVAPASSSDEIESVATNPYTIQSTDVGRLVNYTPSGESIITQLPDAADYEDQDITLRHGGDSYFVVITTEGEDLINGRSSLLLTPKSVAKLKSNGSSWIIVTHLSEKLPPLLVVKSRTTEELPGSPVAGDVYIGTSSPPSEWTASYFNIYDGNSDWHSYAPYEGQQAIVLDETVNSRPKEYVYFSSAWRIKSSILKTATFSTEQTSGTAGANHSNYDVEPEFFLTRLGTTISATYR